MAIKAAILTPNLTMGGAERWIASLLKNTPPGVEWTGVAVRGYGGTDPVLCQEIRSLGVPIIAERPRYNPQSGKLTPAIKTAKAAGHLVRRTGSWARACKLVAEGAQIILGWGLEEYQVLGKRGLPIVHVSHGCRGPGEPCPKLTHATHTVGVSAAACNVFRHSVPRPHVIWNGGDDDRLVTNKTREEARESWGVGPDDIVMGYLGRFAQEKRPELLTYAIEQCAPDNWHAVLYGELPTGQHGEHFRTHERVHVYRPVSAIGDVYAGLDVLVCPSKTEAFSLTLVEGWLSKVPVVSTRVGSLPELEARFGRLAFHLRDDPRPRHIVTACEVALHPRMQHIVDRAHELAWEHFTAKAMAKRWVDYLTRIVSGDDPPPGLYLGEQ